MIGIILCVFCTFLAIEAVRKKLFTVMGIDEIGDRINDFFEKRAKII